MIVIRPVLDPPIYPFSAGLKAGRIAAPEAAVGTEFLLSYSCLRSENRHVDTGFVKTAFNARHCAVFREFKMIEVSVCQAGMRWLPTAKSAHQLQAIGVQELCEGQGGRPWTSLGRP